MEQQTSENLKELMDNPKGSSFEAMPPFTKDGKIHNVCIGIHYGSRIINISHHTTDVGETDKEKIRNPSDSTTVSFPFENLMWLAPRLDGVRQFLNIENGYDKFSKKTGSADH